MRGSGVRVTQAAPDFALFEPSKASVKPALARKKIAARGKGLNSQKIRAIERNFGQVAPRRGSCPLRAEKARARTLLINRALSRRLLERATPPGFGAQ
jgi:hypothetical protein